MNKIIRDLTNLFKPHQALSPGIYHYQTPASAENQYRMHLRIDENGEGLLILNASTILHLNQTATEYAYHIIQGHSPEETARKISNRYQIDSEQAQLDFIDMQQKLTTILEIPDLDPVTFLDISREEPYSGTAAAPYRLDCALTYRLPEKTNPDLAPVRRVDRELSTDEWLRIIDQAWQAGIPHLIFTGGEPTLREDLLDLIKAAESNGQVTGLLTDGYILGQDHYRQQLLESGLDHLLFALSPQDQVSWEALQATLNEDLHTTVHITVTPENVRDLESYLVKCQKMGANAISLSLSAPNDPGLKKALTEARGLVAETGLSLKWDLPVPYSQHNPVTIELEGEQEVQGGSGRAWFYVEPDGDILPSQGTNQVLGNLLEDRWEDLLK
jgi:hypothetical protein